MINLTIYLFQEPERIQKSANVSGLVIYLYLSKKHDDRDMTFDNLLKDTKFKTLEPISLKVRGVKGLKQL